MYIIIFKTIRESKEISQEARHARSLFKINYISKFILMYRLKILYLYSCIKIHLINKTYKF